MAEARFQVGTVTGFRTERQGRRGAPPGMNAHVFDTLHLYRVVATFRTEENRASTPALQRKRALFRAQQEANRLNG